MSIDEKAEIMLEEMDTVMQIDWNLKEFYLKAIKKGLVKIEGSEQDEKVQVGNSSFAGWNPVNPIS